MRCASPPLATLATLAALLAAGLVACPGAPMITEFLANNTGGRVDEDGTPQDWIEIFNPDGAPVAMGGYHLTDDVSNPGRWTFPAGVTIQPGGYLVVFASAKDRAVAGAPLHTNFGLDEDGEYVALSAPGGTPVLSAFEFSAQTANVSSGVLSLSPGAALAYFNTPTPGAPNNPATAPAETVRFSLTSRTFSAGSQLNIVLSVTSPTATIRYTTNRSVPTASSVPYSGTPIPVTTSTRIRARAFEPNRPDGPVGSETYLMLDAAAQAFRSSLPIVITSTWGADVDNNETVPAHLMIFEPKGPDDLARMTNPPDLATPCSVEHRGSSTAGDPKYSLGVETRDENNSDRNFSIFGMPAESDWVMHAPYEFDRPMMHNDLIYRLSNEAGRYAVRTQFVEHFHNTTVASGVIGGALTGSVDYFGVYSFMERLSREEERVDVERLTPADNAPPNVQGGYIIKVDRLDFGESGITPLSGQSFGGIGTMAAAANRFAWVYPREISPDPALEVTSEQSLWLREYLGDTWLALSGDGFMDPANGYAKWLDVPAVIDHHILNVATKNSDAFRLSGFWHKRRSGRLAAGPLWDFDRSQGSTDGRDLRFNTWRGDDSDFGTDFFHYPWFREMFRDPNFWQAWIDRYDALRKGPLNTAHVHAVIDELAAQLNPGDAPNSPAKRSGERWLGPRNASSATPGTDGTYAGEITWLKNWWAGRLAFMDGQFTRPAVPGLPSGPVPAGSRITLTSSSLSSPGVKIYYTLDGTDPRPAASVPYNQAGAGTVIATLIPEIGAVRAIVPTGVASGGPTGVEWRSPGFDDSAWFTNAAGTINGVGYDDNTGAGQISLLPFLSVRWNTAANVIAPRNATNTMRTVTSPAIPGNQSCYVRWPFSVSAGNAAMLSAPNKLILQLRFDDGFAAWLNGTELSTARFNAPATGSLTWSSAATNFHDDAASAQYADFDISAFMGSVHTGQNVLAIHGLNSGLSGSDFLCQAKLLVVRPPSAPALGAIEYTGPITIDAPLQIFARTLHPNAPSDPPTQNGGGTGAVPNGSSWSAPTRLYYFPGAVPASPANIRITEVLYHPAPPSPDEIAGGFTSSNDFEFIRLTNTGTVPVDLTGIHFSNGLEFTAVPGLQNRLPAGASVVIVENFAAFTYRYGTTFSIFGEFKGELDDGGEHIVLNDKTGAVISDFRYDDAGPWPESADAGHSLLYVSGEQNMPGSWRASVDPGGSAASTYERWLRRYFVSADIPFQPMSQDDDGDGLNNLAEYAFATDPRIPGGAREAAVRVQQGNPPELSIRRRAGAPDLIWRLETAPNTQNWTLSSAAPVSLVAHGDGTETATWRAPNGAGPGLFMRLKVTPP